ncbi:iron-sulfur cluster assembly accessory protein [Bradymonadaceae bacterium TMQ3]|uniref:Iron-sulfur cluster assembly accessory protein n=1 Tax=Lujinxingia sediminis TaxID=2480984 RepID=A0ABY0CW02_9DELT|nr:iron-sulfur cluster assembly accessory protein [Lujinxingia sediminis]RDV36649.1 iron-sulfur cluster assembly accessory protein [Bradymonadaceae bacterium TMQ3]RVU46960.1 iron-sulfur cluster assembly accessory protein [Lujinxingia sediminis]TXC68570.1 iron-sulfur cluster assembly accessory protein [Bradymonadales bacterium TMQ1]
MIGITPLAADKARKMMVDNNLSPEANNGIRIGVKSGGCSGLNYVLDIVDSPADNDRVFERNGVKIFCDPRSYLYLNGTEIDFEDSVMGGGFKFNNPNARRSCGCGTSFAV